LGLSYSRGAEGISDEVGLVLREAWFGIRRCCELFGVPQPICLASFESIQAILWDLATCSSLRLSPGVGLLLCRSQVRRNHMAEKKGFSILYFPENNIANCLSTHHCRSPLLWQWEMRNLMTSSG